MCDVLIAGAGPTGLTTSDSVKMPGKHRRRLRRSRRRAVGRPAG
jgi:2-polyprenyl-6-methoxyphenol hydroxylase-like FAD-dependent oxidoreductase